MTRLRGKKKDHGSMPVDWHVADIKARLEKAGWNLSRLSIHHGYSRSTLGKALHQPWPQGEALIAEAIGVKPWEIWPTRYANEVPNRGRSRYGRRTNNASSQMKDHKRVPQ